MKTYSKSRAGFSLMELLVVIVIIMIITALAVTVAGRVNDKTNRARAEVEIKVLQNCITGYMADNGAPPQSPESDALYPLDRTQVDPTSSSYQLAGKTLFNELMAKSSSGQPTGGKEYFTQADRGKMSTKAAAGTVFSDPFGNPYGYSTAAYADEQVFKAKVRTEGASATRETQRGFNVTGPDIWSTANNRTLINDLPQTHARWVKSW